MPLRACRSARSRPSTADTLVKSSPSSPNSDAMRSRRCGARSRLMTKIFIPAYAYPARCVSDRTVNSMDTFLNTDCLAVASSAMRKGLASWRPTRQKFMRELRDPSPSCGTRIAAVKLAPVLGNLARQRAADGSVRRPHVLNAGRRHQLQHHEFIKDATLRRIKNDVGWFAVALGNNRAGGARQSSTRSSLPTPVAPISACAVRVRQARPGLVGQFGPGQIRFSPDQIHPRRNPAVGLQEARGIGGEMDVVSSATKAQSSSPSATSAHALRWLSRQATSAGDIELTPEDRHRSRSNSRSGSCLASTAGTRTVCNVHAGDLRHEPIEPAWRPVEIDEIDFQSTISTIVVPPTRGCHKASEGGQQAGGALRVQYRATLIKNSALFQAPKCFSALIALLQLPVENRESKTDLIREIQSI
jgi:hypothetical protein